jgi:group I intron endonuclease
MGNRKPYCVYKHTCPNGKAYIGITCTGVSRRWRNDGKGYSRDSCFYNAIRKYGWDNIKHEVLYDGLSEQDAKQKEMELIAYCNTNNREHGYNLTAGGEGVTGYRHTDEYKEKLRERLTGNGFWVGRKHTEETRKRMSAAQKGNKNNLGKTRSEETRAKLGLSHGKPVIKIYDGEEIARYRSAREAAREMGVDSSGITRTCCGKQKTVGGYEWEYVLTL